MSAPQQPVIRGTAYSVNFDGAIVPTSGYIPQDGWQVVNAYNGKFQIEDLAGNVINYTFAGKTKIVRGTLYIATGGATAAAALKPGDTISLTPVVAGEVTGSAIIAVLTDAPSFTGNREFCVLSIVAEKEESMTYTV